MIIRLQEYQITEDLITAKIARFTIIYFFHMTVTALGLTRHGENGLQVGNAGSSIGYDASNKPFTTENIEVTNNTFADPRIKSYFVEWWRKRLYP